MEFCGGFFTSKNGLVAGLYFFGVGLMRSEESGLSEAVILIWKYAFGHIFLPFMYIVSTNPGWAEVVKWYFSFPELAQENYCLNEWVFSSFSQFNICTAVGELWGCGPTILL